MSSLGNAEGPTLESGAVSVEANPPPASKKSSGGRKPPKKSDAAATAAAELERQIQNSQGNPKEIEDDDDAEEEEGEDKAPSGKGKNMLVDHTYTNYAIMTDKELQLLDEHSSLLPEPKNEEEKAVREKLGGMSCTYGPMKKSAGGVVQPFPGKLMDVLDRSDLVDIISWMPHGRAFIVKKPKLFAVDVLPRFFKQTKYLSFTRQLNLWGFKRITKGLDGGAYYHELFLRGRPYLAMRMKRHKVKGTGIKLTPNPGDEPLFYRDYPYMDQLDETRAIAPLPPLPPDRMVFPDQETSLHSAATQLTADGVAVGSASSLRAPQPPLQFGQFPQFSHHAAMQKMMGAPHPYLAGSQGDLSDVYGRPPHFAGERYGGLAMMRGGPLNQSPSSFLSGAPGAYPSMPAPRNYDNVLFAPGVNWGSVAASGQRNDPIQDELTAMLRNRQSQTTAAGAEMFPPQGYSSDRLLMERLRDVDRATQLKREQQDISMLGQGGGAVGEAPSAFRAAAGNSNFAFSGPSISNGLGNGPFDRYRQLSLQQGALGLGSAYQGAFAPVAGQGAQNIDEEQQAVESSVKEALREANHLEELALAQRAKARNIALAGALQLTTRANGAAPPQPQAQAPQGAAAEAGNDAVIPPEPSSESQPKTAEGISQFSAV